MSAATVKAAIGYQTPTKRAACRNCTHGHEEIADRMPPYDTRSWHCRKHRIQISAQAICNDHQRESAAATAAKQGSAHQLSPDQAEPAQGR